MTETKYICQICGKQIHTIDGFLGHLKRVHNVDIDEFIKTDTTYDYSPAKCPICGKLRGFKKGLYTFSGKTCGSPECTNKQKESTCMTHYGCKNPSESKEICARRESTCERLYGVKNAGGTEESIQKIKQTKKSSYGNENYNNIEQMKETTQKSYGVNFYVQTEEFKNKKQQHYQETFGVDHQSQTPQFWEHYRTTCNDRYNTDHYFRTSEFQKKCHKRYTNPKYPDMSWATSWEFKVYDFLTENNIQFEYQPAVSIPYYCEGTYHTYHPDFLVGDRIVEVKGDNFFRINETTGKEEMYLTWQGDLSDKEYEWKCKVMEAKHQCMIANNVIILRKNEIAHLEDIFSQTPFTSYTQI